MQNTRSLNPYLTQVTRTVLEVQALQEATRIGDEFKKLVLQYLREVEQRTRFSSPFCKLNSTLQSTFLPATKLTFPQVILFQKQFPMASVLQHVPRNTTNLIHINGNES